MIILLLVSGSLSILDINLVSRSICSSSEVLVFMPGAVLSM